MRRPHCRPASGPTSAAGHAWHPARAGHAAAQPHAPTRRGPHRRHRPSQLTHSGAAALLEATEHLPSVEDQTAMFAFNATKTNAQIAEPVIRTCCVGGRVRYWYG